MSLKGYPDGASVSEYAWEPLSCVLGQGIYKTVVGEQLLPGMRVSRLQLAQALVGLAGMSDSLAAKIHGKQPARDTGSAARSHHREIQTAVDTAARRYGTVSVQAAAVENGRVTDTYNYGWAERNTAPMTSEYKIRIASISKVMVGMAAMILRDRLFDVTDIDGSFAAGELKDTRHVATLYYHGGPVSRSAASQCKNRMDGKPGAVGTYFAGGLTISTRDEAKLMGLLAADGRYEGGQLLSEDASDRSLLSFCAKRWICLTKAKIPPNPAAVPAEQ